MPLIVGLGNIGNEYEGTRHNVGFAIIYELSKTLSIQLKKGRGPYLAGTGRHKGRRCTLVLPTTYVNGSGTAVRKALNDFKSEVRDCLVCVDDINLPVGTIRLRPGGSDGGHNGLKDIIASLGDEEFPRLRFGIGNDYPTGRQVDFVLSRFGGDEEPIVKETIKKAHDAVLCFVREGIDRTMNLYN